MCEPDFRSRVAGRKRKGSTTSPLLGRRCIPGLPALPARAASVAAGFKSSAWRHALVYPLACRRRCFSSGCDRARNGRRHGRMLPFANQMQALGLSCWSSHAALRHCISPGGKSHYLCVWHLTVVRLPKTRHSIQCLEYGESKEERKLDWPRRSQRTPCRHHCEALSRTAFKLGTGYPEVSTSTLAESSQTPSGRSSPRRSTPALRRTSIRVCRIGRLDGHSGSRDQATHIADLARGILLRHLEANALPVGNASHHAATDNPDRRQYLGM